MPQILDDNKVITTQCQSCQNRFSVHEHDLDSEQNTRCPICGAQIKIALCPACGTSYSIVTDRLAPNVYSTKCKKCATQFSINISARAANKIFQPANRLYPNSSAAKSSPAQSSAAAGAAAQRAPFDTPRRDIFAGIPSPRSGEKISPIPASDTTQKMESAPAAKKTQLFSASPAASPMSSPMSSLMSSSAASRSTKPAEPVETKKGVIAPFTATQTADKSAASPVKPGAAIEQTVRAKAQTPAPAGIDETPANPAGEESTDSGYLSTAAKKYFEKQEAARYSLGSLFALYAKAFHPARIAMGAAGAAATALLMYFGSFAVLIPSGAVSAYVTSFLMYFPYALLYAGYVATAAAIARSVLNENSHEGIFKKCLPSALSAFLSATITGGISLLALNAALVFITRIPQGGTLAFALIFLPVYLGSLFFALLLFAGVWLMPQIHAKKQTLFLGAYRELFAMVRTTGGRLLYYIPLMCAGAALLTGMVLFIHRFAFRMTETAALAFSGDASSRAYSLVPVSVQKFVEIVSRGGSGALLGLVSGDVTMVDSSAGVILGASLAAISLLLYGTLLSVCATVSAQTLALMERGGSISESEKRKGLWTALLLAVVIAVVRFFLWK